MAEPHETRPPLHDQHRTPDPNGRHRLASSACGTSGSTGSPLSPEEMLAMLRAACDELWRRSVQGTSPEEIQQWSRRAAAMRRRIVELADTYEDALHEQVAGHVVARRIERMTRPHHKRLEREQKRAQGGLYAGEKRSPNRPTQVDVDPDAWTVVKANAIRNRKALAAVVGALLVQSLEQPVQSLEQTSVQGRPSAPDTAPLPRPQRRFARLFIGDENWSRLRERAVQHNLPVARLIGLVVEDRAGDLGWRSSHDRD